jgi:hypothetical protein
MRVGWIALVSVAAGTLLGAGLAWSEFHGLTNHFNLQQELSGPNAEAVAKVRVEESGVYDFGRLEQNASGQHAFVIHNDGTGVLDLSLANLSCGQCVQTDFTKASVMPGQSHTIVVNYHTRKPGPQFSERVELATNDPTLDLVMLQIRGFVTTAVRLSLPELVLGSVSANESMTRGFRVWGYESDKLEVVGHTFTNPDQAQCFSLESRRLEPSELAGEEHALAGCEISVTIKSGLPLGAINQTIRLDIQATDKHTLDVPVQGTVVSDLTVIGGPKFNSELNILSFGTLPRAQGATATVKILVKGAYRRETKLTIRTVDPAEAMRATLGEPTEIANGAVLVYPLTVEILKDIGSVNRLGTDQGKSGHVVIDTTHPQAKLLDIRVRFATE